MRWPRRCSSGTPMTARARPRLVLAMSLLASGCAGVAPPLAPTTLELDRGRLEHWPGRPGFVVAAPHGSSDRATAEIARDLARGTGWSAVVVTGFAHLDADGRRLNVNRPTESVPGTPARLERESVEARAVFDAYRRLVSEAAQGPLRLYVEVHGNIHEESAGRVEIATVGISRDDARRLKTLLELIRDARLAAGAARLEIWVESLDPVRYTASAAKRAGLLGVAERALHIELPRAARLADRERYTAVLAAFLTQSAPLLTSGAR